MSRPYWSVLLCFGLGLLAIAAARLARADDKPAAIASSQLPVSFYKQVRPIFQENCQGCHQPAKAGGGFVITHVARILKGGESGDPGVVPGKPDESVLMSQITPQDGKPPVMPKDRTPLTAAQVELVRRWISRRGPRRHAGRGQRAGRHGPSARLHGPARAHLAAISRPTAACWRFPGTMKCCSTRPTARSWSPGWWASRSGSSRPSSRPTANGWR